MKLGEIKESYTEANNNPASGQLSQKQVFPESNGLLHQQVTVPPRQVWGDAEQPTAKAVSEVPAALVAAWPRWPVDDLPTLRTWNSVRLGKPSFFAKEKATVLRWGCGQTTELSFDFTSWTTVTVPFLPLENFTFGVLGALQSHPSTFLSLGSLPTMDPSITPNLASCGAAGVWATSPQTRNDFEGRQK